MTEVRRILFSALPYLTGIFDGAKMWHFPPNYALTLLKKMLLRLAAYFMEVGRWRTIDA